MTERVIRIHINGIKDVDPLKEKHVIRKIPQPKSQLPGESSVIEHALRVIAELGLPFSKLIGELLEFKNDPKSDIVVVGSFTLPHVTVTKAPGAMMTLGPAVAVASVAIASVSGGIYVSDPPANPAIGFFGSADRGFISNLGISAVAQFQAIDVAADLYFKGPRVITIGVNIGSLGPGFGPTAGGFAMFFDRLPTALEFIGVGFNAGVSVGVGLPLDIFVTGSIGGGRI